MVTSGKAKGPLDSREALRYAVQVDDPPRARAENLLIKSPYAFMPFCATRYKRRTDGLPCRDHFVAVVLTSAIQCWSVDLH